MAKTRDTDFVARYGGEEFAIIAPQTNKKGASMIAARIIDLLPKEQFDAENSPQLKLTVSIGIATFRDDLMEKEDLIKRADRALYQAKKLGKNRVCLFGMEDKTN